LAKNFRVFWPNTIPAKLEYWRMTQTPEWRATSTRKRAWRSVNPRFAIV